jgi:hypothetical protein
LVSFVSFLLISRWRTNRLRWRVLLMGTTGDGKQSPAHRPEGFLTLDGDTIRWHGVVLLAAGGALRIWPVFVLGHRFSGLVAIQPGHKLVTSGVYGIPPLLARIRAEERLLRTQFGGEYDLYCTRTSRLIEAGVCRRTILSPLGLGAIVDHRENTRCPMASGRTAEPFLEVERWMPPKLTPRPSGPGP